MPFVTGRFGTLDKSQSLSHKGIRASRHARNPHPIGGSGLRAMRVCVAHRTTARLVVGGRLSGYAGAEPGVIEEARLTIQAGRTVLAAGGYGGAAAAVAKRLRPQDFDMWAPDNYPEHADDTEVRIALDALEAAHAAVPSVRELDEAFLRTLTISHRPADIATATVRLLSQIAR